MRIVDINVSKAKPRVRSLRYHLEDACSVELYVPRLINEHFYCKNVSHLYDTKNRSAWLIRCIVKVEGTFYDSYVYASHNFLDAYVYSMDKQFKDMVAMTANLVEGVVVYVNKQSSDTVDRAFDFLKSLDYDYEDIIHKFFTFNDVPFKTLSDSIVCAGAYLDTLFEADEIVAWVDTYRHTLPVVERVDYYLKNKGYDYDAETIAKLLPEVSLYHDLTNAIEAAIKVLNEDTERSEHG